MKLQYLVQEETCITLRNHYLDEQKVNATGGKVVNMQSTNTQILELSYQKKVEQLLQDQNCFKLIMVSLLFLFCFVCDGHSNLNYVLSIKIQAV